MRRLVRSVCIQLKQMTLIPLPGFFFFFFFLVYYLPINPFLLTCFLFPFYPVIKGKEQEFFSASSIAE